MIDSITLPATIGVGSHLAGRLIESWRRRIEIASLHDSEADFEDIEEYKNTPYPMWVKGLFHALPTLVGGAIVHFTSGDRNLFSEPNLVYAGVNLGLFLVDNILSRRQKN